MTCRTPLMCSLWNQTTFSLTTYVCNTHKHEYYFCLCWINIRHASHVSPDDTLRLGAATFLGPVLPTAKPRNLCARSWEATLCMRKGWLSIRVGMSALGFKWWSCGFTCETCWPSVRKQVLIVSNKLVYSSIISFCDSLRYLWLIRCVDVVGFWGGGGSILLALGIWHLFGVVQME